MSFVQVEKNGMVLSKALTLLTAKFLSEDLDVCIGRYNPLYPGLITKDCMVRIPISMFVAIKRNQIKPDETGH